MIRRVSKVVVMLDQAKHSHSIVAVPHSRE